MAFKTYEELEEAARKAGQSWSDADKNLAKQNLDYGNSIFTYKSDWQNAWNRGDKESAAAIHDQTENFRKQFGNYSGGADGSGYIKDTTYFNYDDPYKDTLDDLANQLIGYGKFQNPYQEQTDKVLQEFIGRDPFSYDPSTDPIWGQYQKTYLREGQRAREDTLGNMAAATGGQTSTAAVHAASQAQDYYNAQMADKIPELYQLAYEMYQGQGNDYLNQINAMRGLGSDALNAWNANLGLLNSQLSGIQGISDDLYNRAYNKYAADYQANRDALSDTRYREETAYNKQLNQYEMDQNAQKQAREQALKWLSMGIMPSDGVIEQSGLDPQDVASYLDAVQTQAALKSGGSSKSSRSSGGSSKSASSKNSMSSDVYAWLKQNGAKDAGTAYAMLINAGYAQGAAKTISDYFGNTYLPQKNNASKVASAIAAEHDEAETGSRYPIIAGYIEEMRREGSSYSKIVSAITDAYNAGFINKTQRDELMKKK